MPQQTTDTKALDLSLVTTHSATVNLTLGTWDFSPAFGGPYTIKTVENVNGTALADTITGNGSSNTLSGSAGGNRLIATFTGIPTLDAGDFNIVA